MGKESKITLKCKFCKKKFETYKCWYKKDNTKYCSKECKNKAYKIDINNIVQKNIKKVGELRNTFKYVCEYCGKVFSSNRPSKKDINTKHYCGNERRLLAWRKNKKNESTGKNNRFWKNGKYKINGYVVLSLELMNKEDKKLAKKMLAHTGTNRIREHRFVMAKHLGRPLLFNEVVHHKNRIKDDNRIENLEVVVRSEHNKRHWRGFTKCPKCGYEEFIEEKKV